MWYSLDCDIQPNKMTENKVLEIEIPRFVNVFFKSRHCIPVLL